MVIRKHAGKASLHHAILIAASILLLTSTLLALFSSSTVPKFAQPKLVLAYFYGWYIKDSWYNGADSFSSAYVPSLGLYNSSDVKVIDTQIAEASSAGINGFIASWWGPGSETDTVDRILLREAAKSSGFGITLFYETGTIQQMNSTMGLEEAKVINDVSYIMSVYSGTPSFLEVNNKPVLFFYNADNWPLQFWTDVSDAVHAKYPSLQLIGNSFNSSHLGAFDGESSYVDLGFANQPTSVVNETYPTFDMISRAAHASGKLWFATASPGFNATNDGKSSFPVVSRNGGATFLKSWAIAQNSNPDGIIVGTWNEYYEGTSIEPTSAFGDYYLQLTARLSLSWTSPTLGNPILFGTPLVGDRIVRLKI